MSRADLLALTPASVAALANLGLVKRAQREIEAGKAPALDEDAGGTVTGTFEDGVITKIPPGVPLRDAPCSCGSSTVCRHRVAVVLAYPAWHAGPGAQRAPAAPAAEEWSPACFTDDQLAALVGKRVMTRAQALLRSGVVIELEGGTNPVAKLPTCAVRFHVPRDLAYARCDCQTSIACEHVVVAAWAFRQAEAAGTPPPCTVELGTKTSRAASADAAPLEEALRLAEHVIVEGVSNLGDADKPRFARARASLSKAGLLWPGALVDDLEMALEAYRSRSARYRTADAVFLLASLEARARAVSKNAALPPRFLLGSDEARETSLDHVRLVSLGARVEADGDRREASVYLADPDSGVVLVASREFVPPADATPKPEPEEGPALARRIITGRVTLGALARGQLVTRAAKRHANHALSLGTTRTGQTSVAPSAGDWDCLPAGLLVRSVEALAEDLRSRPPRLLRPRTLAAQMKVLALEPGAVLELAYRPGDQELVAVLGLTDTSTGETAQVRLVRRFARTGPSALDAIAKALQSTSPAPRFVAGDVRLGSHGLEIDPTAIVTDRVIVPDLETEPAVVEALPLLAPHTEPPIHAAIVVASTLLEEALHDGLARLRSGFTDRAAHAAEALAAVGLRGAQRRILALRDAVKSSDSGAARVWLDAAVRIELTREAAFE
jgi:SWIM zinc finger